MKNKFILGCLLLLGIIYQTSAQWMAMKHRCVHNGMKCHPNPIWPHQKCCGGCDKKFGHCMGGPEAVGRSGDAASSPFCLPTGKRCRVTIPCCIACNFKTRLCDGGVELHYGKK